MADIRLTETDMALIQQSADLALAQRLNGSALLICRLDVPRLLAALRTSYKNNAQLQADYDTANAENARLRSEAGY